MGKPTQICYAKLLLGKFQSHKAQGRVDGIIHGCNTPEEPDKDI